jgi:hypothetical protein
VTLENDIYFKLLLGSVFCKNIPGLKDTAPIQLFESHNFWDIDKTLPYWFVNLCQTIEVFHDVILNDDARQHLNDKGLHIYLDEPLVSYNSNNTKELIFYEEFTGHEDSSVLRAKELDSIEVMIDNNKLTNVTVHTCDYDVEQHYPYYKFKMKLITDDRFVKEFFAPGYKPRKTLLPFTKKFICLNWRYTKDREEVANHLNADSSYISWPYGNSPKQLDIFGVKDEWRTDDLKSNRLTPMFEDSFVAVVTESRFWQPTANFSEKTLKAISHYKPFILVAPPHTLKYLKENYGFKTFSDFWDESYDQEEIHSERMKKILALIDEIDNKPIHELEDIYNNMKEVINHNIMRLSKLGFIK